MKPLFLLLLLLLCGCGAAPVQRAAVAPLPVTTSGDSATERGAASVSLPKTITLAWDNPNSQADFPSLQCDIWSTTNLLISFRPRLRVNTWPDNRAVLVADQPMEFFIARFFDPWSQTYSEWSHK